MMMQPSDESAPPLPTALINAVTGDLEARRWLVGFFQSRLRALVNRLQGPVPTAGNDDDRQMRLFCDRFQALFEVRFATPRQVMTDAAWILRRALDDRWGGPALGRPRPHGEAAGEPAAFDASSAAGLARHYQIFLRGIDGLPPTQREVFELVWFLGAEPRLVGWLIGQSPRVAKRLWRDARDAVRDFVAADFAARVDPDLDTTVEAA